MFISSKQRQVERQLSEYRQQISLCMTEMFETFQRCRGDYDRFSLQPHVAAVHAAEAQADDIRRSIELVMYSKALFPESRGDILGLLEAMDRIPNQADWTVNMLKTHHIVIPPEFQHGILGLVEVCRECAEALLAAVGLLFKDFTAATIEVGKVDQLESHADRLESGIIDDIFSSDMNGTKKLLMRDLVQSIARVSDRAEDAADRVRIVVAKRSF